MTNAEKEDLAALIDEEVEQALLRLGIRLSGTVVELVQRFSHDVVEHAELMSRNLVTQNLEN